MIRSVCDGLALACGSCWLTIGTDSFQASERVNCSFASQRKMRSQMGRTNRTVPLVPRPYSPSPNYGPRFRGAVGREPEALVSGRAGPWPLRSSHRESYRENVQSFNDRSLGRVGHSPRRSGD